MYNKIQLIGHLTRDISTKQAGELLIGNTGIATNYKRGDRDDVMFIDLTFFGKSADVAKKYLKKGSKVFIEGRLVYSSWNDKQGNNRSKHAVSVNEFKFLDCKNSKSNDAYAPKKHYDGGSDSNEPNFV